MKLLSGQQRAPRTFLNLSVKDQMRLDMQSDSYSADFELLVSLLLRHLADEEDLIVPGLLHYGERSVS
jgi:hypothetical protein